MVFGFTLDLLAVVSLSSHSSSSFFFLDLDLLGELALVRSLCRHLGDFLPMVNDKMNEVVPLRCTSSVMGYGGRTLDVFGAVFVGFFKPVDSSFEA